MKQKIRPSDILGEGVDFTTFDKLDRKPEVDAMVSLLQQVSTPSVIAIDAPWGAGKTFFLQYLQNELKRINPKVVYFNAWETDFAEDPLLAFICEIDQQCKSFAGESQDIWSGVVDAGTKLLEIGVDLALKTSTAGYIGTDDLSDIYPKGQKVTQKYSELKSAIIEFRERLKKAASSLDENSPLIILVDELDRCRPNYTIELLERTKHLLNVEGLSIVLGADMDQLSKSVKHVYGSEFNAIRYLTRFVDLTYTLRDNLSRSFTESSIDDLAVLDFVDDPHLKQNIIGIQKKEIFNMLNLLKQAYSLHLRDIQQLFVKSAIVLRVLNRQLNDEAYSMIPYYVCLQMHAPVIFEAIIRGNRRPVIDEIFKLLPFSSRDTDDVKIAKLVGLFMDQSDIESSEWEKRTRTRLNGIKWGDSRVDRFIQDIKSYSMDDISKIYSNDFFQAFLVCVRIR